MRYYLPMKRNREVDPIVSDSGENCYINYYDVHYCPL